jgi:AmmeMemoRadiSam system protein A
MQISGQTRQQILDAACDVIARRLRGQGGGTENIGDDPILRQNCGCFVSIHRAGNHALRGCIGILHSDRPLLESLAGAAEASLKDPRFVDQPILCSELPLLEVEVTVLGPLRRVVTPMDFDPLMHGIFLTVGDRSGCFLPQVGRETGWTRQQLLSRLCTEKLGLPSEAWRNPAASLQIFDAEVIGPQSARPFAVAPDTKK